LSRSTKSFFESPPIGRFRSVTSTSTRTASTSVLTSAWIRRPRQAPHTARSGSHESRELNSRIAPRTSDLPPSPPGGFGAAGGHL
jgi:hypothetical protein